MSTPNTTTTPLVAGATQIVSAVRTRYKGIVVRELAGTACILKVYDHASAASGTIIDIISLAANGVHSSDTEVTCEKGIFIERVSGTTYEGSVRVG